MYKGAYYLLIVSIVLFLFTCKKSTEPEKTDIVPATGTVTDIDGNIYKTVKIGNQIWMAENLKVIHYRNGDAIPNITSNGLWSGISFGAYCNYYNDTTYVFTYGRLYNAHAVDDSRDIAPTGWHVPTDAEWKLLEINLGMSKTQADSTEFRGTDEGGKLKETGTTYWNSPNIGAINSSSFAALPGGVRAGEAGGYFLGINYDTHFISSTESGSYIWTRLLSYDHAQVSRKTGSKQNGFSIRCVKD